MPLSQFEPNAQIAEKFPDLHPAFEERSAVVEANRCLNCFDAPCMGACPTHIDVPGFIKRIASGNVAGSARRILEANILGGSCARVCPVEVLCEGACVMHGRNEKPIEIGRLQRFAMETFYDSGGKLLLKARPEKLEQVVCIGAGPASLACAAELSQLGFQVTVIDRRPLPGGLNTYGVAEYKLRTADSLREIEMIRGLGVRFEPGEIDCDGLARLESQYDAIFLGIGLGAMRTLQIEGVEEAPIIDALDFIAAYKTGARTEAPNRVVVVGAGNTAIDAACAAKRLGAQAVTIIYRRHRESMSAFGFEFDHAVREGVRFCWSALPKCLETTAEGVEVHCTLMQEDSSGNPIPVEGSEFSLECDLVIPAIGQSPLLELLSLAKGVALDHGRVVVDRETGQTTNLKYFAGGDCTNGGREVVDAVADGKRAAHGIAAALSKKTEAQVG